MISVITPCLNIIQDGRKDFFAKMMDSIHNQTYSNIEHIIIDGYSKDGTLELLEEYKKRNWNIKLIFEERRGIYSAMNKGIKLAKGKYINIMNTDDYFIDNNFFGLSISKIEELGVDFTHADRIIKSRTGKPDYVKRGNQRNAYFRMPFRHQTMIVKKEIFDEVGLFDETYKIAADYKWTLEMLLSDKKGYYFPRVFVCSLDGGVSSNREKCIEEVSRVLYESYGKECGLILKDCKDIYLRKRSVLLISKVLSQIKDNKIKDSIFYGFGIESI